MGFCIIGLILKCVYYRYLHLWAWLIMDYITEVKDGHWSCTLISNMYFMGNLKNRKLILCCLPSPLFKLTRFLFGEKRFDATDTHCSRCSCVFTILFVPLIFALALGKQIQNHLFIKKYNDYEIPQLHKYQIILHCQDLIFSL